MFFSTMRKKDESVMKPAIWLPIINSGTSLFAGCAVFTFLGHASKVLEVPMSEIPTSGSELAFVAYPALITLFRSSNVWAVLFFFMLMCIGIDSVITIVDLNVCYFISVTDGMWKA